MIRRPVPALVAVALVLVTASCGGRHVTFLDAASASPDRSAPPARGAVTDHVIVVSIDGLRPDAIERFGAATLQRLMREGSHSLEARTVFPSKTLPSHTSMLTGATVDAHGITWNSERLDDHGHVATPTIFAAARQAGFETAAFFSKSKFRHLQVPGTLDYGQSPDGWPGFWSAERTVSDAGSYLDDHRPNLLFVHLGDADFAGHVAGWMSRPYGWAVQEVDEELARLVESADRAFGPGEYTMLVTADHGGHGRDHGTEDLRDVTIPWIAWGEGVAMGATLRGIRTMDTAGTALWLLGVSAPDGSVGTPVSAAFTGQAAAVASAAGGDPGS